MRLWDVSSGRQIGELLGHNNTVGWLAFAPDGKTLASTDQVETVKLWDLATRKEAAILKPGQVVRGLQFMGDSRILVLAGKSVQLWDVVANREICDLGESDKEPFGHGIAVAPNGNAVAASDDKQVRIWTREGSVSRERLRFRPAITRPWRSPPTASCSRLAAIHSNYTTCRACRNESLLEGHIGVVFAIAFARDGKRLASGGQDRTVRMWDVASGKQQACIANPGPVYGVAWRLTPASWPRWEQTRSGYGTSRHSAPATVLRHAAPVYAVAFSPDGKTLASDGIDGTKLWDPANGPGNRDAWRRTDSL